MSNQGVWEVNMAQILQGTVEEYLSHIHLWQGKEVLQLKLRPTEEYKPDLTIWISILSVLKISDNESFEF
jgi:hypothetical protein